VSRPQGTGPMQYYKPDVRISWGTGRSPSSVSRHRKKQSQLEECRAALKESEERRAHEIGDAATAYMKLDEDKPL